MKIEITQDKHGADVVTIDGIVVSADVAEIILEAVHRAETVLYAEAAASFIVD